LSSSVGRQFKIINVSSGCNGATRVNNDWEIVRGKGGRCNIVRALKGEKMTKKQAMGRNMSRNEGLVMKERKQRSM